MVKIPRRGVEPSYSMQIKLKELSYRITVAMLSPSSQKSPVVGQIIWSNGLRDAGFESYLVERFKQSFKDVQVIEMGSFIRLQSTPVEREAFHAQVKRFEQQLRNRVSSPAKIHSNLTPQSRASSAEVREAAHLMLGLLRRNRVSSIEADLDRILSRAHSRLIRQMTERELRFFDYDLFGEVLSYEKDALMQSIAKKASGHVDPQDLNYMAIHEEIRRKFIQIARQQVQALRFRETPYLDRLNDYVKGLIRSGEAILQRKDTHPHIPFNEEGFQSFVKTWSSRTINISDAHELRQSVAALHVLSWSDMNKAWMENQRLQYDPSIRAILKDEQLGMFYKDIAWREMHGRDQELERLVEFLERDQQDFGQNEPANTMRTSGLLSVQVSIVNPGSGGDEGASFIDLGTGVASSFQHQPRRLNSGRGNNTGRFDYDSYDPD